MHSVKSSVKVVRPIGALTAATADAFREEIVTAIAADNIAEIAIDMAAVDNVDNSGLVALLAGLDMAKRLRKRLSLCDVAPSVRIVFELAQLDQVISMIERRDLKPVAV